MDAKSRVDFINSIASGQKILCPACDSMNESSSRFCIVCGTRLNQPEGDCPPQERFVRVNQDVEAEYATTLEQKINTGNISSKAEQPMAQTENLRQEVKKRPPVVGQPGEGKPAAAVQPVMQRPPVEQKQPTPVQPAPSVQPPRAVQPGEGKPAAAVQPVMQRPPVEQKQPMPVRPVPPAQPPRAVQPGEGKPAAAVQPVMQRPPVEQKQPTPVRPAPSAQPPRAVQPGEGKPVDAVQPVMQRPPVEQKQPTPVRPALQKQAASKLSTAVQSAHTSKKPQEMTEIDVVQNEMEHYLQEYAPAQEITREPISAFAQGLPAWSIVPPQTVVRRKKKS